MLLVRLTRSTFTRLSLSLSSAFYPFQQISCNIITDLPVSSSFDYVLVVVDHGLTKGVIFIPCTKSIDATGSATLFFKHVFTHFSFHDKMILDHGSQFASAFAKELIHLVA